MTFWLAKAFQEVACGSLRGGGIVLLALKEAVLFSSKETILQSSCVRQLLFCLQPLLLQPLLCDKDIEKVVATQLQWPWIKQIIPNVGSYWHTVLK